MAVKRNSGKTIEDVINFNTNGHAKDMLKPADTYSYTAPNLHRLANALLAWRQYHILVITDFDPDGESSGAEMKILLESIGARDYEILVCSRSDGYGPQLKHLKHLKPGIGNIVIELDMGIRALEFAAAVKETGSVLAVVDHHLPDGNRLPCADILVDAHIPGGDVPDGLVTYDGYCTAGLVCKLAQILLPRECPPLQMIQAIAAIAVITDVVPLTEDNRNIFKNGTKYMKQGKMTVGLATLVGSINTGNIVDESDIGYRIGPLLNAPGRLYSHGGELSYKLLSSMDPIESEQLVATLVQTNEKRKLLKKEAVERALEIIKRKGLEKSNPLVVVDEKTSSGIVGLVAGELSERFHVTTIACTVIDGKIKGSARAVDDDNITEALSLCAKNNPDLIIGFGGHKKAAGVTIKNGMEDRFRKEMGKIMGAKHPHMDIIEYDLEIEEKDVPDILPEILRYAPFGEGNPRIIFKIKEFEPTPRYGSTYKTGKADMLKLSGKYCPSAISFGAELRDWYLTSMPQMLDIVGYISDNHWGGKFEPQIETIEFCDASDAKPVARSPDDKYLSEAQSSNIIRKEEGAKRP